MKNNQLLPQLQDRLHLSLIEMQQFTDDYRPLYMYAFFRQDLQMTPGKMAAQAGHAFEMTHEKAKILRPDVTAQYKGTGNGTKICMHAKNMQQLQRIYQDCLIANIPCHLVVDRGHVQLPYFDGNPIYTCIGVGPVYKDEIEHITKRYSLIK
jgi:peptidyl-tRNA hydrolase